MDKKQIKLLQDRLQIDLNSEKIEIFDKYEKIFLEKNSRVNLISKNDEKLLFEKHVFDSLAFDLFIQKFDIKGAGDLLDIGTGGGFPSVPLSILYDELNIFPLDSIRKKIKAVEEIKDELGLNNLFPICDRAENIKQEFDFITSRAVAPMEAILKYAMPHLKKGGYFVAYKSKRAQDELKDAQKTLKHFKAKVVDVIDYTLPLEEIHERNLIVVGFS